MDLWSDPTNVAAFTVFVLSLIFHCNESLLSVTDFDVDDAWNRAPLHYFQIPESQVLDTLGLFSSTLNNYRLCTTAYPFSDEVAYWVKPSEMFAIGRSTVCKILREVVHAITDTLKHEVSWPSAKHLRRTQSKFVDICSLPAVVGAIDSVHVAIAKPSSCPADYFYFKSGGYSVNCQAIVDVDKRFIDLYMGMPGSTNDSRMLRRSTLHHLASHENLMNPAFSVDGHSPYLIGDLGYPLLPWLMVPHHGSRHLSVSKVLFNKRLRSGRCLVENAFGIFKHCFRELLVKTDLHLAFLPDVILCCAILHNLLLGQSHEQVELLLDILRLEGLDPEIPAYNALRLTRREPCVDDVPSEAARRKRHDLDVLLTTRRRVPL